MITHYECVSCMINSLINLFNLGLIDKKYQDKVIKEVLQYYSVLDFQQTPLLVNRNVHRLIKSIINDPDPYKALKDKYNQEALKYYDKCRQEVIESTNPLDTALRFAIAGNIIDFGPGHTIDVNNTLEKLKSLEFSIDHTKQFFEEIRKAKSILYLGDNTGEIVFDRLFIETLDHPNITFAVRNKPILNDATMEDALNLGIDKYAKVITNGDDAPGTLLTHVSDEFIEVFNSADLIISKGQGNFEGLNHIKDKNIFFLLAIKCRIVAKDIGVSNGDFIVKSASKNTLPVY